MQDDLPLISHGRIVSEHVIHRQSPHSDARTPGVDISLIVIHGISLPQGVFGGGAIDALFMGRLNSTEWPELADLCALRVSAHILVRRNGEILQYVPFHRRAWHAGLSCFRGREQCNDFSIGIELEGCDTVPYTASQYDALLTVIQILRRSYPNIGLDHIVGHCDIAPGRKTDPGQAFDWPGLRRRLSE